MYCTVWLPLLAAFFIGSGCGVDNSGPARFVRKVDWIGRGTWLKTDTHVHTVFSDGHHSVSEVASRAKKNGCHVLSITDHGNPQLRAATPEQVEAIEVARRDYPGMTILAGIEWNIPPWDGDAHATVLLPSDAGREWLHLAEFKHRFDDYDRPVHDEQLADDALRWLDTVRSPAGSLPVVFFNHPGRRLLNNSEVVAHMERWRQINDLFVGFSGAPGHQAGEPLGDYSYGEPTADRWDASAAQVGGAWDVLLRRGLDVWAARAPSDFHDEPAADGLDYWPGQFSETWLYAPEHTADGALQAFRAGTFFAAHGHIVREVRLTADAPGLPRPAEAGETIEAPVSTAVTVRLECRIPDRDWQGEPNRIDFIELIAVTTDDAAVVSRRPPQPTGSALVEQLRVPPEGLVVRARGRRIISDGPDLMFYTNPIRINQRMQEPDGWQFATSPASLTRLRWWAGIVILAVTVALLLRSAGRRSRASAASTLPATLPVAPPDQPAVTPRLRRSCLTFAVLYGLFIAYGSLVPFQIESVTLSEAFARFRESLLDRPVGVGRIDFCVNVLLFVPLAFALLGAVRGDGASTGIRETTGQARRLAAIPAVIAMCIAWSMSVEFLQLWIVSRISSRYDMLAHLLGTLAGTGLWLVCGPRLAQWLRSRRSAATPSDRFAWLMQFYLAVVLLVSLIPLDLTIHPADLFEKYRNGRLCLVPFADVAPNRESLLAHVFHAALFVPLGMLLVRFVPRPGGSIRSLFQATMIGGLVVTAIELCQLFVQSRFTSVTDVITGTGGAFAGALLMLIVHRVPLDPHVPPGRTRVAAAATWLAMAAAYFLVPCLFLWAPFDTTHDADVIREQWGKFLNVPFSRMYGVSYLNSFTQLVHKTFLFIPMGGLLAAAAYSVTANGRVRRALLALTLLITLGLALLIEAGQALLPARTPDVSDVLLYVIGGVAGMLLAGWLIASRPLPGRTAAAVLIAGPKRGSLPSNAGPVSAGSASAVRERSPDGPDDPLPRLYIPGLDGLRGLACLAVFGVHWHQFTAVDGRLGPFRLSRLLENGNTGVALFLVLSGFLLSIPLWTSSPSVRAQAALDRFAVRRLGRIIPAYFLCLTALVLATTHWNSVGEMADTLLHYVFLHNLTDRTFYSICDPLWAIAVFAQAYVAFGVVVWLGHRSGLCGDRSWLTLFSVLCAATYVLHVLIVTLAHRLDPWPLPSDVWRPDGPAITRSVIAHLPLFWLGSAGGFFWARTRQRPAETHSRTSRICELAFWGAAGSVVLILAVQPVDGQFLPYGRYHFPIVPALLTAMIVCAPQTKLAARVLESRPLRWLGVISYGVYVYHYPSLQLVDRMFGVLDLRPERTPYSFAIAGLLVTVTVSAISYLCLERRILRRTRHSNGSRTTQPDEHARGAASLAVSPPS